MNVEKYDAWLKQGISDPVDGELDDDFMDIELQIQQDQKMLHSEQSLDRPASESTDTMPLKESMH